MTDPTNDSTELSRVDPRNLRIFIDFTRYEVNYHSKVIHSYAEILSRTATQMMRASMWSKVAIIFLGAVATTSGTLSALYGEENPGVIWFFTIVGLVIATLSGLDAAFKFEARSSGRLSLAGDVTATVFKYAREVNDILLRAEIMIRDKIIAEDAFNEIQDEYKIIQNNQVEYIRNTNQRSAELGVNLKWEETLMSREEVREAQEEARETREEVRETREEAGFKPD